MEENQRYFYIACEASKGNFVVQFLLSSLKLFRETKMNYFYRNDIPIFGALIGGAFRTMTHCVQRRKFYSCVVYLKILVTIYEIGHVSSETSL